MFKIKNISQNKENKGLKNFFLKLLNSMFKDNSCVGLSTIRNYSRA